MVIGSAQRGQMRSVHVTCMLDIDAQLGLLTNCPLRSAGPLMGGPDGLTSFSSPWFAPCLTTSGPSGMHLGSATGLSLALRHATRLTGLTLGRLPIRGPAGTLANIGKGPRI